MAHVNVLVVDDCPHFGPTFVRTIERRCARARIDADVTLLTTVRAAREAGRAVDVAFVDLVLPDGSGLDVVRAWRSRALGPSVTRVMSASVDAVSAECELLHANALAKTEPTLLADAACALIEDFATQPRSASDEIRAHVARLADRAHLGRALQEVLVRRLEGDTHEEIARARGTADESAKRQSHELAEKLRDAGIDVGRDLPASLLRLLIAERYRRTPRG